jgi:probable addiction module antidote protein
VTLNKGEHNALRTFDMAEQLRDEADIVEYLRQVLADADSSELVAALGHIAKARGMSEIARESGIRREALYRALRAGSQPRFDTVQRVCTALGLQLTVEAVSDP